MNDKTTNTETDDTEGQGNRFPAPAAVETDDTEGQGSRFPAPAAVEPDRDTGGNRA